MKTALITGTASGIGLALTRQLLDRGYMVHGIGRHLPPAAVAEHQRYAHLSCDLADLDALPDQMAEFLSHHPHLSQLDIVLLNAGQFCNAIRRVSETPLDELMYLQRLNCFSVKLVLDALMGAGIRLPLCAVSASIAGERPRAGNGGYALSKAALNMMMELYALEHPETFFAVIGLCVVDTFLSNKIGTLPLPNDPIFAPQAALRARAVGAGYAVTTEQRAAHLLSLLQPLPDPRLASGQFVEIRALVPAMTPVAVP